MIFAEIADLVVSFSILGKRREGNYAQIIRTVRNRVSDQWHER